MQLLGRAVARRDVTAAEEEAIEAMRRGDVRGLETVVLLHQTRALRMALALTGNQATAEDVVSDAFVSAFERIANLKPCHPFEPWFRGIVRNLVRRRHRASTRFVAGPEGDALVASYAAPLSADPVEIVQWIGMRNALLDALNELPPAQREVLILRYVFGLSEKEVAAKLGLSLNTVKSHLHRGRARLRPALESQGFVLKRTVHGRHARYMLAERVECTYEDLLVAARARRLSVEVPDRVLDWVFGVLLNGGLQAVAPLQVVVTPTVPAAPTRVPRNEQTEEG